MKIDLATMVNEEYVPFALLFLHSLRDAVPEPNIRRVFVFDTGLSDSSRERLSQFPGTELVSAGFNAPSAALHDPGWRKNVDAKTRLLLALIESTRRPTVLIDADCVFVGDFTPLLSPEASIAVCSRRKAGYTKYIGSFFGAFNVHFSIQFLNTWIQTIGRTAGTYVESAALSAVLESTPAHCYQELAEDVVGALQKNEQALIYHLKSGPGLETIEARLRQPHVRTYLNKYLN